MALPPVYGQRVLDNPAFHWARANAASGGVSEAAAALVDGAGAAGAARINSERDLPLMTAIW